MFQKLSVFLQRRSATSRVCDNRVVISIQQRIDVAARQLTRIVPHAGMHVQRPATALRRRDRNFASILSQYPYGGLVQSRETDVGDASTEERHPMPLRMFGRQYVPVVAEEERRFD